MPQPVTMWKDKYGKIHETEEAALQEEQRIAVNEIFDDVGASESGYFYFDEFVDRLRRNPQEGQLIISFIQGLYK